MPAMMPSPPRAQLRQLLVSVEITPHERALLVEALERQACQAADNSETILLARYLFDRAEELRGSITFLDGRAMRRGCRA
jgi:hypothetical protein